MLFVCHIPSAVISIECPHHKNLEKKYKCDKDKYKNGDHKLFMYPLSIFKREFCVAWNDCLQHLERALFVSYKNGDIQSPSFYHHIVVPLGKSDNEIEYRGIPCPALDSYEELKCIGLTSEIVSEGNHDDVEYIPHPPEIRNQSTAQSSINVENDALLCSGIQGLNVGTKIPQKSILRPGRLYV